MADEPLDPELAELVDAYARETARDPAQVEAALHRVGQAVGPGSGPGPGSGGDGSLSLGAKVGIAGAVVGVLGVAGVAAMDDAPRDTVEVREASRDGEDGLAGGSHADPARSEPGEEDASPAAGADGAGLAASPSLPTVSGPAAADDGAQAEARRVEGPAVAEDDRALAADDGDERGTPSDPGSWDAKSPRRTKGPRASAARELAEGGDEPPSAPGLDADIALMQSARAALRSGRAAQALELLGQHRREFPSSAFAVERDASEVAALCAGGRNDEAERKAAAFTRAHPKSKRDLLAGCQ